MLYPPNRLGGATGSQVSRHQGRPSCTTVQISWNARHRHSYLPGFDRMTPDPGGLRPLVEAGIPRTCAPRRAPRSLKVTRPTPLYEPQLELDLELDQQTPRKEVRLPAWRALQALYAPDSPRQVVSSGTLCALRVLSGHRPETGDSGAAASDQIHRPARPAMNSFSGRPSHPKATRPHKRRDGDPALRKVHPEPHAAGRVGARQGNAGARLGLARPGDGLRATRPRLPFGGGEPPASRVLRDEPAQCLAHNVSE